VDQRWNRAGAIKLFAHMARNIEVTTLKKHHPHAHHQLMCYFFLQLQANMVKSHG